MGPGETEAAINLLVFKDVVIYTILGVQAFLVFMVIVLFFRARRPHTELARDQAYISGITQAAVDNMKRYVQER